jgi:hypothetical protein
MADEPAPGGEGNPAPDNTGTAISRHDAIPENYFDGETKSYKFEDIGAALSERDTLKATFDERAKLIPEKPDDYKFDLPQDFKLPDGYKWEARPDDPLVKGMREIAVKHKLTTAEVADITALYASTQAQSIQSQGAFAAEQTKLLGENATGRRKAAGEWLGRVFGNNPAQKAMLESMLDYAPGVEAIETLIAQAGGPQARGTPGGDGPSNRNKELAEKAGKPGGGMALLREANRAQN